MNRDSFTRNFFYKLKGLIGIALIIAAIGGIFFWENFGRQAFLYKQIVVLNKDTEKNTVITKDMISLEKRDESLLIPNAVTDPSQIIGLKAKQYIPKGLELSKRFFDKAQMVLKKDEYIAKIPDDWIYAFPQSLRRTDHVFFYPIKSEKEKTEPIAYSNGSTFTSAMNRDLKPLTDATVAYVKDANNREVIDTGIERMDGSSNIASIEIITDKQKIDILKIYREAGYGFIIFYQ